MIPSTITNNFYLAKYAPKTIPGPILVWAQPGDGDGLVGLHLDVQMGLEIAANDPFNYYQQLLIRKYAPKLTFGLVLVWAHHGVEVGWVGLHPDGQRYLET